MKRLPDPKCPIRMTDSDDRIPSRPLGAAIADALQGRIWRSRMTRWFTWLLVAVLTVSAHPSALAQTADDCLTCHEDPGLKTERNGRPVSLYIDRQPIARSIHG